MHDYRNTDEQDIESELPDFVNASMVIHEDLQEFNDIDKLRQALSIEGLLDNPWYADWLELFPDMQEDKKFSMLWDAGILSVRFAGQSLSKEDRTVIRYELHQYDLEKDRQSAKSRVTPPKSDRSKSSGAPWENADEWKRKKRNRSIIMYVLFFVSGLFISHALLTLIG